MIETPTLRLERIQSPAVEMSGAVSIQAKDYWVIIATSYNRDAPSGLGEFGTKEEAEAAMKGLQARLDARPTKGPSKKEIRKVGAD